MCGTLCHGRQADMDSCTLQVRAKYNQTMCEVFRETFCWMPLAYVIQGAALGVRLLRMPLVKLSVLLVRQRAPATCAT